MPAAQFYLVASIGPRGFRRCGLRFEHVPSYQLIQVGPETNLSATPPMLSPQAFALVERDSKPSPPIMRNEPPGPAMLVLREASDAEAAAYLSNNVQPRDRLEVAEQALVEERAKRLDLEQRLMRLEVAAGNTPPSSPPAPPSSAPAAPGKAGKAPAAPAPTQPLVPPEPK